MHQPAKRKQVPVHQRQGTPALPRDKQVETARLLLYKYKETGPEGLMFAFAEFAAIRLADFVFISKAVLSVS